MKRPLALNFGPANRRRVSQDLAELFLSVGRDVGTFDFGNICLDFTILRTKDENGAMIMTKKRVEVTTTRLFGFTKLADVFVIMNFL